MLKFRDIWILLLQKNEIKNLAAIWAYEGVYPPNM